MNAGQADEMRAVLFDYDDTLVDTRRCKYAALKHLAQHHYGMALTDRRIDAHWGIAYRQLFFELFRDVDPDLERVIHRYEELDSAFPITAFADTARVLDALLQRCLVGIVTAAGRTLVESQLHQLQLPVARLSLLQTAEDTPYHKPDPRVFDPALARLRQLGVSLGRLTYVGDSLKDFMAARDAGLSFFGVLRGTSSREEFAAAGARTVGSLDELLARL
ncbi:MAG: HAD hydrolase-like protein [Polyangiaceae bacterium]